MLHIQQEGVPRLNASYTTRYLNLLVFHIDSDGDSGEVHRF